MQLVNDVFDEAASERLGVNRTDQRVMDVLDRFGPLPAGRAAELARLSRPAMTTALDRLERAGYARRVPDPDDRRRVLVELTPLARERAEEIWGPFAEIGQREFSGYKLEELQAICRFLERAALVSERELERIRPREE